MSDRQSRSLAALLSFLAVAVGCWMAWPPLGLIVPGAVVFLSLAWTHHREGGE